MSIVLEQDWARMEEELGPLVKNLARKTILITGAGGFLASYLISFLDYLNENGHQIGIVGLVRDIGRARTRFSGIKNKNLFQLEEQDMGGPLKRLPRVDFIIHAASQASPKYYSIDPVGTSLPNIVGTLNLLNFAKGHPVSSFLFISSGEVYGELGEAQFPTKEEWMGYLNPIDLRSCYAESKRMGENLCVSYFSQHHIPCRIARPFHTYGPGMDLNDGRVFADFVRALVKKEDLVIHSDGSARRAFCYISDATVGFLTVLLVGTPGHAYNVGNEAAEVSIKELAERLVSLGDGTRIRFEPRTLNPSYVQSPISRNCPDTAKLRSLGWRCAYGIEDGFRRTVESFS